MDESQTGRGRGVSWPYVIEPLTDSEAFNGVPTLICPGDLLAIVAALEEALSDRPDLIAKFQALLDDCCK